MLKRNSFFLRIGSVVCAMEGHNAPMLSQRSFGGFANPIGC